MGILNFIDTVIQRGIDRMLYILVDISIGYYQLTMLTWNNSLNK